MITHQSTSHHASPSTTSTTLGAITPLPSPSTKLSLATTCTPPSASTTGVRALSDTGLDPPALVSGGVDSGENGFGAGGTGCPYHDGGLDDDPTDDGTDGTNGGMYPGGGLTKAPPPIPAPPAIIKSAPNPNLCCLSRRWRMRLSRNACASYSFLGAAQVMHGGR